MGWGEKCSILKQGFLIGKGNIFLKREIKGMNSSVGGVGIGRILLPLLVCFPTCNTREWGRHPGVLPSPTLGHVRNRLP